MQASRAKACERIDRPEAKITCPGSSVRTIVTHYSSSRLPFPRAQKRLPRIGSTNRESLALDRVATLVRGETMTPPPDLEFRLKDFLRPSPRKSDYWERLSILRSVEALAARLEPGPMIDVGCGLKPYVSILQRAGSNYWGVDYPVTVANAHSLASRADVFAESQRLPFRTGAFTTVISTQVLEHVPDPGALLGEMARVLRPGGSLVLSAPMTWPLHEEPYDFYRYTIYGLRRLLTATGLEVVVEIPRGPGAYCLGQLFLALALVGRGPRGLASRIAGNVLSLAVNLACPVLDRLWHLPALCLGWTILARKSDSGEPSLAASTI